MFWAARFQRPDSGLADLWLLLRDRQVDVAHGVRDGRPVTSSAWGLLPKTTNTP